MVSELQFTSAQRGLYPGATGYCTVKATAKLPPRLRELLESLSNYRAPFPPGDSRAARNPVGVSYLVSQVGGTRWKTAMRYTVSNALPKPIKVSVVQAGLYGDTRIADQSLPSAWRDADRAGWVVEVPANGTTDLTVTFDTRF